jgi:Xaa-Pro aminopeptidase
MPKGFLRDEYVRRWQKLRALMKQKNLDCLIVPAGNLEYPDEPSDVTYLTGTGGGWVVFPYDGKVISIGGQGDERGENEAGVELRPDGRPAGSLLGNAEGGQWSPALINLLREKGMTRAHIGVGDLSGAPRNEEGGVSYTTVDRVVKAFPQAKFESAVEILMRGKLARSPAEIAVMEKADEVAESGLKVMLETARPGVSLLDVWIKMYETMLRASGESGSIAFTVVESGGGGRGRRMLGSYTSPHGGPPPASQMLRAGQMMRQEITGRVLGYAMQVMHGVYMGSPAPAEWETASKYCIEVLNKLVDFIRPGKTMKEVNDFYVQLLAAKGFQYDKTDSNVFFHLGEGPRMGPYRKEGKDLVVEEGWVFHNLKPMVPMGPNPSSVYARNTGTYAQIGDGVVVTANGSRRLGKRELEVVTLG